jgi:hypothetical protein
VFSEPVCGGIEGRFVHAGIDLPTQGCKQICPFRLGGHFG